MKPTLTEFSYGYCITEELAVGMGPRLRAAPYFPSLYTEGQKGGGFDVQIGSALFLQFKLCEKLTRRSAKEVKEGVIDPPFYRFWLHPRIRSKQHQMLIDLENQTGNQVYYIAPGFAELDELNSAYVAKRVVATSAMFSPREVGALPDNDEHRIAFRFDRSEGWFLSEPRSIAVHRGEKVLDVALSRGARMQGDALMDWLTGLAAEMKAIIYKNEGRSTERFETVTRVDEHRDPLRQIAYLARAYFACEVFFVSGLQ